jgi:hypothetical protein
MTTREKVIERQGRSSKTHLEKQGNRKRTEKKRFCQKKKKKTECKHVTVDKGEGKS